MKKFPVLLESFFPMDIHRSVSCAPDKSKLQAGFLIACWFLAHPWIYFLGNALEAGEETGHFFQR